MAWSSGLDDRNWHRSGHHQPWLGGGGERGKSLAPRGAWGHSHAGGRCLVGAAAAHCGRPGPGARAILPAIGLSEGIFFDKNAQSAAKLGHARGVVLLCLERRQIRLREHPPARVKRTLTGNGRAEKAQVARMVCAVLGLDTLPPADAADALALAMTELRLDPRAQELEDRRRRMSAKKIPPGLAAAIARAKATR